MSSSPSRSILSSIPTARQWEHIGFHPHHGVAVPLFSLHSNLSCGIGEYTDLLPLIDWCKSVGMDVIQLLPLNDTGDDTSPYNAITAFGLNPIHLGLAALPYLQEFPELRDYLKKIQTPSISPHLDYPKIYRQKMDFLKSYYASVRNKIVNSEEYQTFVGRSEWLKGYGLFKILKARLNHEPLESWPVEWKNPSQEQLNILAQQEHQELEWHCFVQYLCDKQLHQVKETAEKKGIFLMGDIPILVSRDSADVWLNGDIFLLDYSSGAPPDMYSIEGQNWGSPIYNWEHVERDHYRWWIARLQHASRYYQIYRIDHILGFFRIWSIPKGLTSKEGRYIPEDSSRSLPQGKKNLLALIQQSDMLPIGEDLGVVPPGVREALAEMGICGTKILRWERDWDKDGQFKPTSHYPLLSLSSVSTHDSETLQLWWQNCPIEARAYAKTKKWDYLPKLSPEQRQAILYDSHHSGSLFHINLLQEYFALVHDLSWPDPHDERINIPGIISSKNWSYRYRQPLEFWMNNQELSDAVKKLLSHHGK